MYFHFSIESQVRRILKKLKFEKLSNEKNEYLNDITDGNIYKNFLASKSQDKNYFTFLFNTDGISKCSKSNLTIWPVYCAINEIPEGQRFCLENIIIAGLSVADSKPNFDVFLAPIKEELLLLEQGIDISQNENYIDIAYFHVLYAVMDKPARADILNLKGSNGEYGCIKCLQPGENLRTNNSKLKISNYLLYFCIKNLLF